jgi:hypothetical protein
VIGAGEGIGGEALSRPGRRRRWLGPAVVLAVAVATVFGGYLVAAALEEPAGPPLSVGGIVEVQPLTAWRFAGRYVAGGVPGARLTRGSGNLDILATSFTGSPEALARTYADRVLRPGARVEVSPGFERVQAAHGTSGARFSYVGVFDRGGSPIEGEVTVVVSPAGTGAVFDAWAPEGLLQYVRGDIGTMESDARFA